MSSFDSLPDYQRQAAASNVPPLPQSKPLEGLALRFSALRSTEELKKLSQENSVIGKICELANKDFSTFLTKKEKIPETLAKEKIRLYLETSLLQFESLQQEPTEAERIQNNEWKEALSSLSNPGEEEFLGKAIVGFFPDELKATAKNQKYILHNASTLTNHIKTMNLNECLLLRENINTVFNSKECDPKQYPSARFALGKLVEQLNENIIKRVSDKPYKNLLKKLELPPKLYEKPLKNIKETVSKAFAKLLVDTGGYSPLTYKLDIASDKLADFAFLGVDFNNKEHLMIHQAIENLSEAQAEAFITQAKEIPGFQINIEHKNVSGQTVFDVAYQKEYTTVIKLLANDFSRTNPDQWQNFLEKHLNATSDSVAEMRKVVKWFEEKNILIDLSKVQINSVFGKTPLLNWISNKLYSQPHSTDKDVKTFADEILEFFDKKALTSDQKKQLSDSLKSGLQLIVNDSYVSDAIFSFIKVIVEDSENIDEHLGLAIDAVTNLVSTNRDVSLYHSRLIYNLKELIVKAEANPGRKVMTPLLVRLIDVVKHNEKGNDGSIIVPHEITEVVDMMKDSQSLGNLNLKGPRGFSRYALDAAIPKSRVLVKYLNDNGATAVHREVWKKALESEFNSAVNSNEMNLLYNKITQFIDSCTSELNIPLSELVIEDRVSFLMNVDTSLIEWSVIYLEDCQKGNLGLVANLLADKSIAADKVHLNKAFDKAYVSYKKYVSEADKNKNSDYSSIIDGRFRALELLAEHIDETNPPELYLDYVDNVKFAKLRQDSVLFANNLKNNILSYGRDEINEAIKNIKAAFVTASQGQPEHWQNKLQNGLAVFSTTKEIGNQCLQIVLKQILEAVEASQAAEVTSETLKPLIENFQLLGITQDEMDKALCQLVEKRQCYNIVHEFLEALNNNPQIKKEFLVNDHTTSFLSGLLSEDKYKDSKYRGKTLGVIAHENDDQHMQQLLVDQLASTDLILHQAKEEEAFLKNDEIGKKQAAERRKQLNADNKLGASPNVRGSLNSSDAASSSSRPIPFREDKELEALIKQGNALSADVDEDASDLPHFRVVDPSSDDEW